MRCVYCRQEDVQTSDAHLFPDAIGGVTAARDTVCVGCNSLVNTRVENSALPSFSYFRAVWGIQGRRRRPVRVRAILRAGNRELEGVLNERGEPNRGAFVQKRVRPDGRIEFSIFGEPEAVEARRREIVERYPDLKWEDFNEAMELEVEVPFELDLAGPTLRRLAAKVAFERCAQRWGAQFMCAAEFDVVRNFVLDGTEPPVVCGVLADADLLDGSFNFALPNHAVYLNAHQASPILGAVVGFFSLFYYWVLISQRFTGLGQTDDLLLEHAQAGLVERPLLRGRTGDLVLPWSRLLDPYMKEPAVAVRWAARYAVKKLGRAADEYYGRTAQAIE